MPAFYLPRLTASLDEPRDLEQFSSNLLATLLFEQFADGSSPLAGLCFDLHTDGTGAIQTFRPGGRLRLRGVTVPNAWLSWQCSQWGAAVRLADGASSVEVSLPVPKAEGEAVEFIPFKSVEDWGSPVIEDGATAFCLQPEKLTITTEEPPLSLNDSLASAYGLLRKVWPEVIPWVKILIPAFVQMPGIRPSYSHAAGSFGLGSPIYLSRVVNPLFHAEDIVHELQHQRLQLVPTDEYFGSTRDERQTFISPYRADPRPLFGLHLGLHAFIAVNELRLRVKAVNGLAVNDLLRDHRRNVFAFRSLMAHERFSREGQRFFQNIAEILQRHHDAIEPTGTEEERGRLMAAFMEHRDLVLLSGAPIKNADVSFAALSPEDMP